MSCTSSSSKGTRGVLTKITSAWTWSLAHTQFRQMNILPRWRRLPYRLSGVGLTGMGRRNIERRLWPRFSNLPYPLVNSWLLPGKRLIVCTEWKTFQNPDFVKLASVLSDKAIFDGRNMYSPEEVENAGIAYYGIGRGRSIKR